MNAMRYYYEMYNNSIILKYGAQSYKIVDLQEITLKNIIYPPTDMEMEMRIQILKQVYLYVTKSGRFLNLQR